MIETKDKRRFFTSKNNFLQLGEFIKVFKPSVFLVEMKKGNMLELDEVANLLCDTEYKKENDILYDVIEEVKIEKIKTKRNKIDSQKIRDFIKKELLDNKTISIKKLKNKFKSYELSDSTYYNQIKAVKIELGKQGFKFIKMKRNEK
jgi:hypothetical protein